ncbi:MAG: hypothetical protein Q7S40_04120 [Opitutaceae bacterium]|nr:hypothetical protein [Opitutaceae bacterium]
MPRSARSISSHEGARQPTVEILGAFVGLQHRQLRADDRNDALLLDEVEQILPRVVVEDGYGRGGGERGGEGGHSEIADFGLGAGETLNIQRLTFNV